MSPPSPNFGFLQAHDALEAGTGAGQFELLRELESGRLLPRQVADLFHHLRKAGNDAAYAFGGTTGEAVHLLKVARELAMWIRSTPGRGFAVEKSW